MAQANVLFLLLLAALAPAAVAQSWSPTRTPTPSNTATPSSSNTASASQTSGQSPTMTASPTTTPLPCPLKLYPGFDVIGEVLSKTFQASEAVCMLNCCNVGDLCVGYSFASGMLGATTVLATTSTITSLSDGFVDKRGNRCGTGYVSAGFEGLNEYSATCSYSGLSGCPAGGGIPGFGSCTCGDVCTQPYAGWYVSVSPLTPPPSAFSAVDYATGYSGCAPLRYTCTNQSLSMSEGWTQSYNCYGYGGWHSCGATDMCCSGVSGRNSPILEGETTWYKIASTAIVQTPASTITSATCTLLSSITSLVPSNGWTGGIKLSALGAS